MMPWGVDHITAAEVLEKSTSEVTYDAVRRWSLTKAIAENN